VAVTKKIIAAGVFQVLLSVGLMVSALNLSASVSEAQQKDPFEELGIVVFKERLPAPDFALQRMSGGEVRLSDLRGKVIFINFFATWCSPCAWEMPEIEALYNAFKDEGFEVVAVSIDASPAPLVNFAKLLNLSFPIVHDPGMAVARRYGFRGPPLSYLIDRRGYVVGGAPGPRPWNAALAHEIVKRLLEEPMS